jgi:hypothetical protein
MKSLVERFKDVWNQVRQTQTEKPGQIAIPRDHIDNGKNLGGKFERDEHYFQVEVNEMFLTYEREWFAKYDPMVLVVSEFTYDKKVEAVPFVVGPMMRYLAIGSENEAQHVNFQQSHAREGPILFRKSSLPVS